MMSPQRRWSPLAALLAAVLVLPWATAGAATQDELEATRAQIDATIDELGEVDQEAEQTAEAVADAEERVAELEQALNDLLAQQQAQEQAVRTAQQEADEAAAERDRIATLLGDRARRAFMGGTPDPVLVLGSQGIDDVNGTLDSIAMLDALSARENASVETLDAAEVRAQATAERLDEELAALEELRTAREEVLAEAEEVLQARAESLDELEAQSDRLMAEREDLEAEETEIQELIQQQEQAAQQAPSSSSSSSGTGESDSGGGSDPAPAPPPSSSGCYQWPANGAVTSGFGARWGRLHAGLDIDGNTGDPLYAAQSGTVISTGYQGGYGQLTLISHSDGVTTAYAHQSSIGVSNGQSVSKGQYIGAMGATGNVTGSHLHFETRPGGRAVNPLNYLC